MLAWTTGGWPPNAFRGTWENKMKSFPNHPLKFERIKELIERYLKDEMYHFRTKDGLKIALDNLRCVLPPGTLFVCGYTRAMVNDFADALGWKRIQVYHITSAESLAGLENKHVIFLPQPNSPKLREIKLRMQVGRGMVGWNIENWR